jgi:hypothetical protein
MVPHPVEKIKHMFEKMLHLSVVEGIVLLSNKRSKTFPKVRTWQEQDHEHNDNRT